MDSKSANERMKEDQMVAQKGRSSAGSRKNSHATSRGIVLSAGTDCETQRDRVKQFPLPLQCFENSSQE